MFGVRVCLQQTVVDLEGMWRAGIVSNSGHEPRQVCPQKPLGCDMSHASSLATHSPKARGWCVDWQAKPQWRLPGVDCGTLTVDKCQRRGNLEAPQRLDRRSHLDGRAPFMVETAAMSRHLSKRSSLLRDDEHVAGWSESGEGAMRQDVCSSVSMHRAQAQHLLVLEGWQGIRPPLVIKGRSSAVFWNIHLV